MRIVSWTQLGRLTAFLRPMRERGWVRPLIRRGIACWVLLIVIGHGCHGDDVDHEPILRPPVEWENQRDHSAEQITTTNRPSTRVSTSRADREPTGLSLFDHSAASGAAP